MTSDRLLRALAALLDALERAEVPAEVEARARRVRAILEAERRPPEAHGLPPIDPGPRAP